MTKKHEDWFQPGLYEVKNTKLFHRKDFANHSLNVRFTKKQHVFLYNKQRASQIYSMHLNVYYEFDFLEPIAGKITFACSKDDFRKTFRKV